VRPDGYIGAIVPPEDIGALETYMQKAGLSIDV